MTSTPISVAAHPDVRCGAARRVFVAMPRRIRERFFGAGPIFADNFPLPVAVAEPEPEAREWEYQLRQLAPEVLVSGWGTPPIPRAWLDHPGCPLRYVCHSAGAVRGLVPRPFLERGGIVTNWGTMVARPVAEHALLLALAALRELPAWAPHLRRPQEEREDALFATRSLTGKRVGIHGFGAIARELVTLLRPFDVKAAVYAPGVPAALVREAGAEPCATLVELCRRSDVFFECEALTPATQGSLSAEAIDAFPPDAVFVNVGRGRVVDEAALLAAARERRLRLAVDVVAEEPIAADSLWLRLEGVLVSPHIAGPTRDEEARIADRVRSNVHNYLTGAALEGKVTLEIYDRST